MSPMWAGRAVLLLIVFPLVGVAGQSTPERSPAKLTQWLSRQNYTVRFVYNAPVDLDFPPLPTTFRQAEGHGPAAGAWTTGTPLGLTEWISPEEMRGLAEGLERLNLVWDVSFKPMVFRKELVEPPPPPGSARMRWKIPMQRRKEAMEIDVTCDAGSAVADLPAAKICSAMKGIAPVFRDHFAIDVFRDAREDWGCKVPSFRYYQHQPWRPGIPQE